MKYLFFLTLAIIFFQQAIAQNSGIRGQVFDTSGTRPLKAVVLHLSGSGRDTTVYTNNYGNFQIPGLPEGVYRIECAYYTAGDSILSSVKVLNGAWTDLKILLKKPKTAAPNLEQQLQGRVAGVTVTQSSGNPSKSKYHRKGRVICPKFSNGYTYSNSRRNKRDNTEEYRYVTENAFKKVRENPLSTFSVDVDNASYSNVRRYILQGQLPPADAVRIEEMINYFKYEYPAPQQEIPFAVHTEGATCPWNKEHLLVQIAVSGKEIDLKSAPANNLIFLIDVSGSMSDDLELVKGSLKLLVNKMRATDKIAIVVYAGAAGIVLPPTPGTHKDEIMSAMDSLEAGGSTAGGEGILLAYKLAKESYIPNGNNRIIMATDGDFNVGVSSEGELVRIVEEKRNEGIFLTTLGFGEGNLKDSKMEMLSDKGNGNYYYIDNILEAQKVLIKQLGGTLYTVAKDVKLQVEFNPALVKEYRLIGYENRLMNNEDFKDDTKDAGDLGAGHFVTALYEIVPSDAKGRSEVGELRYQETKIREGSFDTQEMLFVKIRYKKPGAASSEQMSLPFSVQTKSLEQCSNDFRFCTAVAAYGQLLKDSKFKGNITYQDILDLAKASRGTDAEGYRTEFIRMVEMTEAIQR